MMLALRMGRTLDELTHTMSSQEFSLWVDMYKEDQWGEKRDDFRTGVIASTVANYAGKMRGKDSPPAQPSDFLPSLATPMEEAELDPVAFFTAIAADKRFDKKD